MIQKLFSHVVQGCELLMQMMEVFSSSSTSRRFRSQSSLVDGEVQIVWLLALLPLFFNRILSRKQKTSNNHSAYQVVT